MEKQSYKELRTQPEFLKLLIANIISRFGDSVDVIAYSWVIYEITGSESLMAMLVGINYLPTVILMPFIGAIVENIPKKTILWIADICRFILVSLIIIFYTNQQLNATIMIVFTLITSIVECFRMPASGAITPMLLDKEYFKLGKGASYSSSKTSELLGFILVGSIIALWGAKGALIIDAITFLVSAILVSSLKYTEVFKNNELSLKKVTQNFKEGIEFAKQSIVIKNMGLIGLLLNCGMMPLTVFKTPYVVEYLQLGPSALSFLQIGSTIGIILGSFFTPKLKNIKNQKLIVSFGILIGASLLGLSVSPNISIMSVKLITSLLCMAMIGFSCGVVNVIIGSTFMKAVPSDMMGRMSGVTNAMLTASMPLASFICSALALKFTVLQILIIFGVFTIFAYLILLVSNNLKCFDD